MTTHTWPRTARLDAPRVINRIADITGVRLTLEGPCPGGEVGAGHSRRTARLLDRIHEIGATAPSCTGDDLVHLDFHPGNVLADGHDDATVDAWLDVAEAGPTL